MSTMSSTIVDPRNEARLPKIVIPSHYDLVYKKIDLQNFTFEGTVRIDLKVPKEGNLQQWPRGSLLLHALELNLWHATLIHEGSDKNKKDAQEFRYHAPSQTCEIVFDAETNFWVPGAKYQLTVDFSGILNDRMRGLYRSTYVGLDGVTRTMATTQFEPTDARLAFPCIDEPAMKATFRLQVTIPGALDCISNTPAASIHTVYENAAFIKTITYQETPKMSTYLLALVVGEFDSISKTSEGVQTTVYTVPGKAHQGHFCLDTAVKCLDLFQKLFGVPYPLQKSDLLAIPDFAAGAMENWGCVTYREAKILVKEGSTSETLRRGIARTVCHELAHQWFGNLVTMDFWTQLWLKEGVARFSEFIGIDSIFPQWDAWNEFVQEVFGLAQSLDSMKSSHPVEVEVHHPDEINEIFDAISYAKGASIIRMCASYIGFETFLEGMKLYLSRHAYGNATTPMFWQAMQDASGGKPVVALMTPWTTEVGFPLLVLPEDDSKSIRTPRFLASGPGSGDEGKESTVWPIPVTAIVEGEDSVQGPWIINGPLGDESASLLDKVMSWTKAGKWFKLNVSQAGFYRVSYTRAQWEKLATVMSPVGPLSSTDRLGLISDSFAAGRAGYTSIVDSLRLVQNFGDHESAEYAVWQELSENLSNLASLYRSEDFFPRFQAFIKKLYIKQMDMLGWEAKEGESQRTGTLRGRIISMLRIAGEESVCVEAFQRFSDYAKDPDSANIPGDLQRIVFRAALSYDEAKVYPMLKQIFEESTFPEEQRNCLSVLGCVADMGRHADMLNYALFSGKVRLQDVAFSLNSLSSTTDVGGRSCWILFRKKFEQLFELYGDGPVWGAVVGLSCRGLRTLEEADEVEDFFDDPLHPVGSAKRRLAQGLEAVRTRATRLERDSPLVASFLAE